MRIAVVDMVFNWPPDGGGRVDVKEVFCRLAKHHEVRLFAPRYTDMLPRGQVVGDVGFDVETIPFTSLSFNRWGVVRRFREALDRYCPDIVFVTDGWHMKPWAAVAADAYPTVIRFYAYECLCLRLHGTFMKGDQSCYRTHLGNFLLDYPYCNACGLKLMIRDIMVKNYGFLQEYLCSGGFLPSYRSTIKRVLGKARHVIVSNEMIRNLLSDYSSSIKIFPGAIHPELFPEQPFRRDKPVRIGMVGRIGDANKGYNYLRRSFVQLLEKEVDVELWCTGDPPTHMPDLPHVHYKGWYAQESLTEFYSQVDICVVPSIWQEPFGLVALEAMSSGKPVVVTKVGGLQNLVKHGETGFVVTPRSSDQLFTALLELVQNPELRRQMGKKGAEMVRTTYTWDRVVEKYYQPLLSS
jgi:glycosyltransferase involved in cell wall biosynthesis